MRTISIVELDAKSDFGTFIPISYPTKQRFCRFAKKNIPIRRDRKNMKKRNISTTSVPRAQQISRQRRSEMFNLREKRMILRTNNQIARNKKDKAVPVLKNVYIDDQIKTYIWSDKNKLKTKKKNVYFCSGPKYDICKGNV